LQNKFPRIIQSDLSPLKTNNKSLNWNPPGHGEIYTALMISGVLDKLLQNGLKYAFISNSDNLGAVPDNKILGWFAQNNIPFLMEVCERTEADKKGGHLAQTHSGQLLLREVAQCSEDEIEEFQNISKYSYFNTNNLWVNLEALKEKLIEYDFVLPLSMIVNPKEVEGIKIFQIETAMGAAISVFEGSRALCVNRNRFAPVKKYSDLEIVRSADYILTDDYRLIKEKESI
jgi:UDP-N-acetylglucosamine pyrophosphorylase